MHRAASQCRSCAVWWPGPPTSGRYISVVTSPVKAVLEEAMMLLVIGDRSGNKSGWPSSNSSFIGRNRELEEINKLLSRRARLITLIGPGGIGKTRLAAEAVQRYSKSAPQQVTVYWVRLARLAKDSDGAAILEEIAHTVVGSDFSGRSIWDALFDSFIRHTGCPLLVLDSCEHLLPNAAEVACDLLNSLPELTILATSRKPLGWVDEHLVPVRPLTSYHAMDLFKSRAELTGYPVTDPGESDAAAAICRRVNNYPLYIQLAAARLTQQPLAMILRGMTGQSDDTRLRWSNGPRSGVDPRHRGMIDAIDWSYELCTEAERLLFEQMSVFAAGYDANPDDPIDTALDVGADLEAVEAICSEFPEAEVGAAAGSRPEIERLLERLVEHSLVSVHFTPTTVRYSLVESLRLYAQRRLQQRSTSGTDEPKRLALRHLRFYRDKISCAASHFASTDRDLAAWAQANWANIVTAIETGLQDPDLVGDSLTICLGLIALRVPFTNGSIREIRRRTECCLEANRSHGSRPAELEINAMAALIWLALVQGCSADVEEMLDDCVAACSLGLESGSGWRDTTDTDIGLPAAVEFVWGLELFYVHGDTRAIMLLTRARDKFSALGNLGDASLSEMLAALTAGLLGTAQQATDLTRRYLDRVSISGAPRDKAWAESARAIALIREGAFAEALVLHRSVFQYYTRSGDQLAGTWAVHHRIWSLARIVAADNLDRGERAALATEIAHLSGGVATLRDRLGINLEAIRPVADGHVEAVAVARRVLGPVAYATAEAQGKRLRPERNEVQRLALGELTLKYLEEHQESSVPRWNELTPAEREVSILAAAQWTNPAIAARRGKSIRTIDAQMASILHKLAISSREDIIEHIPRDTIDQVHTETLRRPRRHTR